MTNLTPEMIDAMEAGREMDRLISEKINIDGVKIEGDFPMWKYEASGKRRFFYPSTDIAAAWEVAQEYGIAIIPYGEDGETIIGYAAGQITTWRKSEWIEFPASHFSYAPTAPLAICRAALKTIFIK